MATSDFSIFIAYRSQHISQYVKYAAFANVQLPNDNFFQNIIALIRQVARYHCDLGDSAAQRQLNQVAPHRDKRRRHLAGTVASADEARPARPRHSDGKINPRFKTKLARRAAPTFRTFSSPGIAGPDVCESRIANHNKPGG
jgi:hypothetical protein